MSAKEPASEAEINARKPASEAELIEDIFYLLVYQEDEVIEPILGRLDHLEYHDKCVIEELTHARAERVELRKEIDELKDLVDSGICERTRTAVLSLPGATYRISVDDIFLALRLPAGYRPIVQGALDEMVREKLIFVVFTCRDVDWYGKVSSEQPQSENTSADCEDAR